MADYYCQTSFAIEISAAEAALIDEIEPLLRTLADGFETADEAEAAYAETSPAFQALFPKGDSGDPFIELTSLFEDSTWPTIGCDLDSRPDPDRPDIVQLYVSGDGVRPLDVAALLRRVCSSGLPFRFGWAHTCSRHHLEAFDGGYMEVTADRLIPLHDLGQDVGRQHLVVVVRDRACGLMFWNNKTGFGPLNAATVFTQAEAEEFRLPYVKDAEPGWLELPPLSALLGDVA